MELVGGGLDDRHIQLLRGGARDGSCRGGRSYRGAACTGAPACIAGTDLEVAAAGLDAGNLELLGKLGRQAAGLAGVRHGALQAEGKTRASGGQGADGCGGGGGGTCPAAWPPQATHLALIQSLGIARLAPGPRTKELDGFCWRRGALGRLASCRAGCAALDV